MKYAILLLFFFLGITASAQENPNNKNVFLTDSNDFFIFNADSTISIQKVPSLVRKWKITPRRLLYRKVGGPRAWMTFATDSIKVEVTPQGYDTTHYIDGHNWHYVLSTTKDGEVLGITETLSGEERLYLSEYTQRGLIEGILGSR